MKNNQYYMIMAALWTNAAYTALPNKVMFWIFNILAVFSWLSVSLKSEE